MEIKSNDEKITEDQAPEGKEDRHAIPRSQPAAPIGGTSSIYIYYIYNIYQVYTYYSA